MKTPRLLTRLSLALFSLFAVTVASATAPPAPPPPPPPPPLPRPGGLPSFLVPVLSTYENTPSPHPAQPCAVQPVRRHRRLRHHLQRQQYLRAAKRHQRSRRW